MCKFLSTRPTQSVALCVTVTGEHPFRDKALLYRFWQDKEGAAGSPSQDQVVWAEDQLNTCLSVLTQKGPDAIMRMIMRKPWVSYPVTLMHLCQWETAFPLWFQHTTYRIYLNIRWEYFPHLLSEKWVVCLIMTRRFAAFLYVYFPADLKWWRRFSYVQDHFMFR